MKEIFYRFPNLALRKNDLYVYFRIRRKSGNKSLGHLGHTYGIDCLKTLSKH